MLLSELSAALAGVTDTDEGESAPGQPVTRRRPLAQCLHLVTEQCHCQLFDRGSAASRLGSQTTDQVIGYVDPKSHKTSVCARPAYSSGQLDMT